MNKQVLITIGNNPLLMLIITEDTSMAFEDKLIDGIKSYYRNLSHTAQIKLNNIREGGHFTQLDVKLDDGREFVLNWTMLPAVTI